MAMDRPWPWTVHGHGPSMAMDRPWPWTVHGHGLARPAPAQKVRRLLYKLTTPILYKLTAPMTKHEYHANILGVPHAAF